MKSTAITLATVLLLSTSGVVLAQNAGHGKSSNDIGAAENISRSNNIGNGKRGQVDKISDSNCPSEGSMPLEQMPEKCRIKQTNVDKTNGATPDNGEITGSTDYAQ